MSDESFTDEQLHTRWREGDRRAGKKLVDRYMRKMWRFFANKVADVTDVDDLVAETFERCVSSLETFRGEARFRTFIYGIARNVLREYFRKRVRREGELELDDLAVRDFAPSASTIMRHQAEERLLLEALRSIAIKYQIVLELKFFENRTAAQIAETLDKPVGTINTWIRTGKIRLEEMLRVLSESNSVLESTMDDLEGWASSIRRHLVDHPGTGAHVSKKN